MLDFIILGCLKIKDMTGYEIKKTMSFSTTFFTNVNDGNMYPTLKRLLEQGAVAVREETENGRHKKVYAITPEGEARLAGWLEQPLDPMVFKYEMLVRLFFARNLEAPALIRLLAQHVAQIEQLSASLQVVEQGVGKKGDWYQRQTMRFGLDFYHFLSGWFDGLKSELENRAVES